MADRLIYESRKSKVFHRTEADGSAYAVKVLSFEFPTPDDISQFHNEFDIIEGLCLPGVRKGACQTNSSQSRVANKCVKLCGTKKAPLGKSRGAVEFEVLSRVETALLVEMV